MSTAEPPASENLPAPGARLAASHADLGLAVNHLQSTFPRRPNQLRHASVAAFQRQAPH